MKKLLALVLALVMTLSLCTISNAAFSDAKDISYTEAVDVMAGLKILEGYDTGAFNPTTVLNREQAAKILAYMQLGKKTADALNVSASFTDTQGNWAESYIAYCASQGIIAGVGGNKFNPKGELTGYAFAKMVLCALGYDAEYEGLTGSDWMIKTAKLVNSLELNDGMSGVALAAGMTREQAAKMAFNALFQPTYTFKSGTTVAGTGLTISVGGQYGSAEACLYDTVFSGECTANKVVTYGFVTKNASNDKTSAKNGTTTVETFTVSNGSISTGANLVLNITTGSDMIGKAVKVYYKDSYVSASKPGTVFALVDKTVETKVAKADTAKELKAALAADNYAVTDGATVSFATKWTNGGSTSSAKAIKLGTTSGAGTKACTLYGWYDSASKTTIPYGYAVADSYTVNKVDSITTTAGKESITLQNVTLKNNATEDVVNAYEGIAAKDIVAVYQFGDMYNLVKLDKVSGKATAVSTKADAESVTVNGTTYSFASVTNYSGESNVAVANIGFTDEHDYYLDKDGKIALVTGVEAVSDVVYVVATYNTTSTGDYGAGSTKYFIQGVNTAGEEVKYQVYHSNNTDLAYCTNSSKDTAVAVNTLYKVTTAYDSTTGVKATMATLSLLENPASTATKGTVKVTNAALAKTDKKVSASGKNFYFASDVKFIFVEESKADLKVTVSEGVRALTDSTTYTVFGTKAASAANFDVHYVFVSAAPTDSTSAIVFANETSASTAAVPYTNASGQTEVAYQHTVYVDGEKTTILTNSNEAISGFFKISTDATTGLSTKASYVDTTTATAKHALTASAVYNGLLTVTSGVTDASLASAKFVDLTDNEITTAAELKALVGAGGVVTVSYVYNVTDNDVSIIYITKAFFTATIEQSGTKLNATFASDTFGTSNKNVAATDGVSYEWKYCETSANGTFSTVADATTSELVYGSNTGYYKVTITVVTTDGDTFKATSTAFQPSV